MNAEAEVLSESDCRRLLGGGVFGRVAVCTPEGPMVLPVNYSVVAESVVFRTVSDGVLARHDWSQRVAFEVDHVDYAEQRGWSVVAAGVAHPVLAEDELAHIHRTWEPRPWASGERTLVVRLAWDRLTGRRLGSGWTYAEEMPVRRRV